MVLRKFFTVLVAAYLGAGFVALVLNRALGQDGTWALVVILAAGVAGGLAGVVEARGLTPMEPGERRDAILGWGLVIGIVVATACLALPLPWGVIAAAAVVVVTFGLLRALTGRFGAGFRPTR